MLIVLLAILGAVTLLYVAAPLRVRSVGATGPSRETALLEQRDVLLRSIKELEFDQSMGKVEADDYNRLRAELTAEAATVLQRLERGQAIPTLAKQAVQQPAPYAALTEADIEAEILIARARRKRERAAITPEPERGANWTCTCGRSMSSADRFCASCGKARAGEAVNAG